MKNFSAFRDKLTSKQAATYSAVISLILTLPVTILLIISIWPKYQINSITLSILITTFLFCALYLLFDNLIFKAQEKRWKERHENAKQRVISKYKLTTKSYTQVNYNYEKMLDNVSDKSMLLGLLKIPEYDFYLKLITDEEILLTVTDKYQHIVYNATTKNFIYIETYFQKIH